MRSEAVVHVVDDDVAVRQSLSFLLASFLDNVREPPTGCIVTDVRMPGIDGIEFLRRLKARGFAVPVIVMTGHADVPLAVEAMKEGAVDFVEKPFDDDLFLAAIRSALSQQARSAEQNADMSAAKTRLKALSEREAQVLQGLVAGKANKVIAYDLGISPRTVEIYRANVMAKMQASSLSELVRMVLLAGAPNGLAADP
jgi:two-component system response regulator FixJ